ncbi:MAG: Ig-like domain-containing protein, partial [Candidatus Rokubacteria bacterium]|nr:Ig-like domain-containing protein [Candidatus Rokubacteria bacterium]
LAPSSALQGGPAFTLTVTGSDFVPASTVRWNGSSRTTTFVSATQLTASISAADLAATGTPQVTVVTPAPGGGTSSPLAVVVFTNPPPSDVTPPAVSITAPTRGIVSGNVSITASATDNVGVTVTKYYVDGALIGTFAPPLYALVWDAALVPDGTHTLIVQATDAAGNTGTSAPVTVTVARPNPVPTLSTLAPSSAKQGGRTFTLKVTGSGFVPASTVRWNGSSRTTTFVSATRLTATIPAADIAAASTVSVTVFTPAPSGGTSSALPFVVHPPRSDDGSKGNHR